MIIQQYFYEKKTASIIDKSVFTTSYKNINHPRSIVKNVKKTGYQEHHGCCRQHQGIIQVQNHIQTNNIIQYNCYKILSMYNYVACSME